MNVRFFSSREDENMGQAVDARIWLPVLSCSEHAMSERLGAVVDLIDSKGVMVGVDVCSNAKATLILPKRRDVILLVVHSSDRISFCEYVNGGCNWSFKPVQVPDLEMDSRGKCRQTFCRSRFVSRRRWPLIPNSSCFASDPQSWGG